MEFTNTFHVPGDVDTTFATLSDLERVAPCLPGATLEEVDGDTYTGKVKVKVGPIQVTYRGTATVAETDVAAKRIRIEAAGKEARGSGTARAEVTGSLTPDDEGTSVTVATDLTISGKPAQFGRGVMEDVGTRIIDTFAERLRTMLEEGELEAGAASAATGAPASGPEAIVSGAREAAEPSVSAHRAVSSAGGARSIEPDPGREDDALDLGSFAGPATAKRLAPLAALLSVVLGGVWWYRRRRGTK